MSENKESSTSYSANKVCPSCLAVEEENASESPSYSATWVSECQYVDCKKLICQSCCDLCDGCIENDGSPSMICKSHAHCGRFHQYLK
jgi:hypothetical protein